VNSQVAPIIAALITGTVSLTVGVLAYIFGRVQKEHEVRFTRLYERRAEVIAALYTLLHDISEGFRTWAHYDRIPGEANERNKAFRSVRSDLDKFRRCYLEKDIWISEGTRKKLDQLYGGVNEVWNQSAIEEARRKGIRTYLPRVNTLREELKAEFRSVLGVMDSGDEMNVVSGRLRVIFGLTGPSLIGLGVGGLIHLLRGDTAWILLWSSLVGLGIGLLLEFVRPTKKVEGQ